jgi:hypothetical protein
VLGAQEEVIEQREFSVGIPHECSASQIRPGRFLKECGSEFLEARIVSEEIPVWECPWDRLSTRPHTLWEDRLGKNERKIRKVVYRCKNVKRSGDHCNARMCIFYPSDSLKVYIKQGSNDGVEPNNHSCDEIRLNPEYQQYCIWLGLLYIIFYITV